MPPLNKPLHRLKYLLETCAVRDRRYKAASDRAGVAAGPTPGEFSKLLDFFQMSDAALFHETHNHLNSMLVCCVTGVKHKPDLHQRLKTIERVMPVRLLPPTD